MSTPKRTVIHSATVITADADDAVLMDASVVVEGDRIVDLVESGRPEPQPGEVVVDAGGGIVMPGLVDAHSHLPMTLYRGLADDRDLQSFLGRLLPLEAATLDEEAVAIGARLAMAEMLRAGATTALDMYWYPEATAAVAEEAGLRLATGPLFIGATGPDHHTFAERTASFRATGPHAWTMIHGTYTMSVDELRAAAGLARSAGTRIHLHAAENQPEVDQVVAATGLRPVELLDREGLLGPDVVLAHAVVLTDHEVARLGETATAVAHCPLSNLKLASGVCRVSDLLAAGATVGLGTDGPSSSNDLDLFAAMRFAGLVAKGAEHDASALSAHEVLKMATIGGARALGLEEVTGSIEVGKAADLVRLDPSSPSLTPSYDPVSSVVYAASRADVVDVWVAGRRVVEDRRATTVDVDAAIADVRRLAAAIA
jgi:5-methylthioadenosine/S-adenosylhomocysteine deaminase